jgi:RNA polymerase sigma factor (sigma-70 family)
MPEIRAEDHLGLVAYVVRLQTPRHLLRERPINDMDEFQIGCIGLLGAIRRFDPAKGTFLAFARKTIEGTLKDWRKKKAIHSSRHDGTVWVSPDDGIDLEADFADAEGIDNRDAARFLLDHLNPRERRMVEANVMLGETLEEVGQANGLTRQRVQQIVANALREMREKARRHGLLEAA